jgi:hypothetical protein
MPVTCPIGRLPDMPFADSQGQPIRPSVGGHQFLMSLDSWVRTRLKRIQYRPALINRLLAQTQLNLTRTALKARPGLST